MILDTGIPMERRLMYRGGRPSAVRFGIPDPASTGNCEEAFLAVKKMTAVLFTMLKEDGRLE